MPKPGKSAAIHRKQRSKEMSAPVDPPAWVAAREASDPTWDESGTEPIWISSDDLEAQMFQRTRRHPSGGPMLDFAVGLQVRHRNVDEAWVDVVRVDCADGGVHVDRCRVDGDAEKDFAIIPPECREDLDAAFRWALDYLWDIDKRLTGWA